MPNTEDIYSTALLNKLKAQNAEAERVNYQTRVDIPTVEKAIYYCKKYHADQKRDSGEPYYSHPITVAKMVSSHRFNTDVIVSAILHDIIEDTEVTQDMINDWFGPVIANNVEGLSRNKPHGKITSEELINDLYNRKMIDALFVKLFDRMHNLETIGAKSPEKQEKTIRESIYIYMLLAVYINSTTIEQQLINLCRTNQFIKKHVEDDKLILFREVSEVLHLSFQNEISPTKNPIKLET